MADISRNLLLGIFVENLKPLVNEIRQQYKNHEIALDNVIQKHTLLGISQTLEENSSITDLILMEELEKSNPVTIKFIDQLTEEYPWLNLVVIISDDKYGTEYLGELASVNYYNAILGKDASIEEIVNLLMKPRSKKQMRQYYGLDLLIQSSQKQSDDILTDEQVKRACYHISSGNLEDIQQRYEYITQKYNTHQNLFLIKCIPLEIKKQLESNDIYKKYVELLNNTSNEKKNISVNLNFSGISSLIKGRKQIPTEKELKESTIDKPLKEKDTIKKEVIVKEKVVKEKVIYVPDIYHLCIGIMGSEDGVGVTTIAASLAETFANRNIKTAIIDLDIVDRELFYYFTDDINDFKGSLSKEGISEIGKMGRKVSDNLTCFIENPENEIILEPENLESLIQYCSKNYNVTIIDIPAYLDNDFIKRVLNYTEHIMIVTDQKFSTLSRMAKRLYVFKDKMYNASLVVNKYVKIGGIDLNDIKSLFNKNSISKENSELIFDIDLKNMFTVNNDALSILKAQKKSCAPINVTNNLLKDDICAIADFYYGDKRKKKIFGIF